MQFNNSLYANGRKGYGSTTSTGCDKESLNGGHMDTDFLSHHWVKEGLYTYARLKVKAGHNENRQRFTCFDPPFFIHSTVY